MTAARRRFEVVPPDWGQSHLTLDAVVAFVDDELSAAAHARATRHVDSCPECADDVAAQAQTRAALRSAHGPTLSSSLLSSLQAIPRDAELPEPPAGLAVAADGTFVQMLRPAPVAGRRRFGAGIAVSGLAVGSVLLGVAFLPAGADIEPDATLSVEPVSVLPAGLPGADSVLRLLDARPPVCLPRAR